MAEQGAVTRARDFWRGSGFGEGGALRWKKGGGREHLGMVVMGFGLFGSCWWRWPEREREWGEIR